MHTNISKIEENKKITKKVTTMDFKVKLQPPFILTLGFPELLTNINTK